LGLAPSTPIVSPGAARMLYRWHWAAREGPFQRIFRLTGQAQALLEHDIRLEERSRERARVVRELDDTLFQGNRLTNAARRDHVDTIPQVWMADRNKSCTISRCGGW